MTQINNLKIRFNKFYEKWQVATLSGKILEEFSNRRDAVGFAQATPDFVKSPRRRKGVMCDER